MRTGEEAIIKGGLTTAQPLRRYNARPGHSFRKWTSPSGRFDRLLGPQRDDRVDSRRPPRRDVRRDRADRDEHERHRHHHGEIPR